MGIYCALAFTIYAGAVLGAIWLGPEIEGFETDRRQVTGVILGTVVMVWAIFWRM